MVMTDLKDPSNGRLDAPDGADAGRTERRRPSRAGRGGSLLELALLGVLVDAPQHGYELKKRLDGVLPAWSSVSFGSLYPTLGRLERAGDVVTASTDADDELPDETPGDPLDAEGSATPMTGTLSGELAAFRARLRDRSNRPGRPRRSTRGPRGQRGRKVYTITAAGRVRLHELLTSLDPADDRAFALQVTFASHLETTERLAILGQRRGELTARLERASRTPAPPDAWRASLHRHTMNVLTADIAWVDSLLAGDDTTTRPAEPAAATTGGTP